MADTVKHTPGPWAISGRSSACIRTADQDQRIAYLETADNIFEVCEANARLIAAAPDFMTSAKKLISAFDELCSTTSAERILTGRSDRDIRRESEEAIDGLRAAIAKAEGLS